MVSQLITAMHGMQQKTSWVNNMNPKDEKVTTIDVTPKWIDLYPIYAEWVDSGSQKQKQLLKDELLKLCKVADAYNAMNTKNEED